MLVGSAKSAPTLFNTIHMLPRGIAWKLDEVAWSPELFEAMGIIELWYRLTTNHGQFDYEDSVQVSRTTFPIRHSMPID
jgi:hypothetical protein